MSTILDARRLEAVKIAALVAMVLDHVDLVLFERGVPALHAIGAFAFPAFALAFGIGLATTSDPMRVVDRLVPAGVLAQAAWWSTGNEHPANVLLVFALCALAAAAARAGPRRGAVACTAVVLLCAAIGEGSVWGPALVGCGYLAASLRRPWITLLGGAAWMVVAPTVGGLVGVLAVMLGAWRGPVLPKVPALPWLYAAHLVILVLAASTVTHALR